MLAVNFLIHDNSKAALILSLLKELPFVELLEAQESDQELLKHYQQLLQYHLRHPDTSATVKQFSPRVAVCKSFQADYKQFSDTELNPYYAKLGKYASSAEATKFRCGEQEAYCLIVDQYRFLYRLIGDSIWIFNIYKFPKVE